MMSGFNPGNIHIELIYKYIELMECFVFNFSSLEKDFSSELIS